MLARIAHSLYWVGRSLARAEHTGRMLDALVQSEVESGPDDPASVAISWRAVPILMGAGGGAGGNGEPATRVDVIRYLTSDPANPLSIRTCVAEARESARTLRDTISAEMWEALNTFHLELRNFDPTRGPRTGPYSFFSYVRNRCALFWGLTLTTMRRDEGNSFLLAGGRLEAADMVLRMLRVALPPMRPADDTDHELTRRDGNAHALLLAVGGFQAFMRSAAPPNAVPVARFLLFERDFPESVAASVEALYRALGRIDSAGEEGPAVLRLQRLAADLRLRGTAPISYDDLPPAFREIQHELSDVDDDIERHYFAGEQSGEQHLMA